MENDYLNYNEKYKNFNEAFSDFQLKSRTKDSYYNYEAYKDLKIVVSLYAEIYDFQGFKSLELSPVKLQKLLTHFDCFQKKDLLTFFNKKLTDYGHDQTESIFVSMLQKEEIKCSWKEIKNRNKVLGNMAKLTLKISSYNLYTLSLTLLFFFIIIALVFAPAPFSEMEILEVRKNNISTNIFLNHISNLLLYMFGVDGHMSVSPKNFGGTLLIVIMKISLILVIGNFVIKEMMKKIKFQ